MNQKAVQEPESKVTFNNPESWQIARKYASLLGSIPSTFTTTIRTLKTDDDKHGGVIGRGSIYLAERLLRGPSMMAPFYHCTLTFHSDKISNSAYLSTKDLIMLYAPADLATVIGLIYLCRRSRKLSPPDEWQHITGPMHELMEVGGFLGYAIPAIGASNGLAVGSMRHLAMTAFLKHDLKGFKEYRRFLKAKNQYFNPEFEMNRWGCTSIQIGSILLQSLGFGISVANSFTAGITPSMLSTDELDDDAYRFSIATLWIDSLLKDGNEPKIVHRGDYYPLQSALHKLMYQTSEVRDKKSKYMWLEKGKDSISQKTTPQLYQEALKEADIAEEEADIAEEAADAIPSEELEELDSDE